MMRRTRASIGAAVMIAAAGLTACSADPDSAGAPDSTDAPEPTATPDAPDASSTGYRDGEYSATGWYGSLPSHHDVTLTIGDGVVTAVEITTPAEDPTSLGYQQRFADALPGAVIGQDVGDLAVDRLAGSSGCSEGFMDALAQITEQATEGTP
jgi:uncharacterized protein with FMN-binding domain